MIVNETSVVYSRTINLGNYESMNIEAGASASVKNHVTEKVKDVKAKLKSGVVK